MLTHTAQALERPMGSLVGCRCCERRRGRASLPHSISIRPLSQMLLPVRMTLSILTSAQVLLYLNVSEMSPDIANCPLKVKLCPHLRRLEQDGDYRALGRCVQTESESWLWDLTVK